ncbi:MAG: hypothetical protein HYU74_12645 [Dechloromonas sp.]|nr:hypothetical protein [Dechloromonas sp.]
MLKQTLFALAIAVVLSACTTPHPTPIAASSHGSVTGVATAALWGTYEMEVAPVHTRLVVLYKRTARQAEAGRIPDATAVEIMRLADLARSHIDAARRGSQTEPTLVQRASLAEAIRLLDHAATLLEK